MKRLESTSVYRSDAFVEIGEGIEVFDYTAHLLKIIIRRRNAVKKRKQIYVFHSWRAVLQGKDVPLDQEEISFFKNDCPIDLFLVGNEKHVSIIEKTLNRPAIVLPYTVFIPENIFLPRNEQLEYDVVFSCMFRDDQLERKRANLFLDILRNNPSLKALWIGGYNFFERWAMESSFNSFFKKTPYPKNWNILWRESEYMECWHGGGGIFQNEKKQLSIFEYYRQLAKKERLNLILYRGLSRSQVAYALSRSRTALVLSSRDQWPRCITESLASGVPVVAIKHLISGLQLLNDMNSIVLNNEKHQDIVQAIASSHRLNRNEISNSFYKEWGIINSSRKLIEALRRYNIEWTEIVDWQRPFESNLKKTIRQLI